MLTEELSGLKPGSIHPSSVIHPRAEIGDGVTIGPFCTIGPRVRLGRGSILRSHVNIEGHTEIGPDNEFFPFCSVGSPPQDLKYKGEETLLRLGARNVIRECVTLQPGTVQGGGKTEIGDGNLLMAYTHVAHDCMIGNDNIFANGVQLSGHVIIMNQAVLGGMSAIHQFCRIGDLAMLGGGSMVVQDVPPFVMVHGNHAAFRGLNLVGLKRKGHGKAALATIKKAYDALIVRAGPTVGESIGALKSSLSPGDDEDLVNKIIEFVEKAERGIVRRASE